MTPAMKLLLLSSGSRFRYDHIFSYGQSLSLGEKSTPIQTTSQPYDSVSFVGGARPLDTLTSPDAYASFIPLVENTGGPHSGDAIYGGIATPGETPLSGMCHAIKQLSPGRYKLIGTASGAGAYSLTFLAQGTNNYNLILAEIGYAKAIATAEGKAYRVPAVTWMQGESGPADGTYKGLLQTLHANLNTDIKAATGQTEDVVLLTYQTRGVFTVGKQQLAASEETAGIYMAMPCYQLEFDADNMHLTGEASRIAGAYFGKAYKAVVIDGQDWRPLSPDSISYSGNNIDILCHVPSGSMVIDTTLVPAKGQYGFSIFNESAVAKAATVSIVGGNTIRLALSEPAGDGWVVQYANPTYVNGGNIRDQDSAVFDPAGTNYPLHNWLVAFEMTTA